MFFAVRTTLEVKRESVGFDDRPILQTIPSGMSDGDNWRFWIDTGGTFTDCLALTPSGEERRLKVLSTGSVRARVEGIVSPCEIRLSGLPYCSDGFWNGYRIRLARRTRMGIVERCDANQCLATLRFDGDLQFKVGEIVDLDCGEEAPVLAMRLLTGTTKQQKFPKLSLRLATTKGTNALLEGKAAVCAFFVTKGFGDLLRIGDQRRLDLFALNPSKPPVLHGPVVEVPERLAADGSVLQAIDLESIRPEAERLVASGVKVAAITLMHSYRNAAHERLLAAMLHESGFSHISMSADLAPLIKIVPRANTTVVDAILSPIMDDYLDDVGRESGTRDFKVMTSAGGLVTRSSYRSKDSLLSGPAGGVVGASAVARQAGYSRIIGFDMGGTSTDVARFEGDFDYRFEHKVGPAHVFAPALRLETVAAGGGSICGFDGAALVVGPESAGANPGPACYGAGGPLTLTDVNLLFGRFSPALFGVPIFPEAAESRLSEVLQQIRDTAGQTISREELLQGFVSIADERMADAIRRISVREGYDPAEYTLVAFGGAGGLHACGVAERLNIKTILFPADSGLLSARGLKDAVTERFSERQILKPFGAVATELGQLVDELTTQAYDLLHRDDVQIDDIMIRRSELDLRFAGQDSYLTVDAHPFESVIERFESVYRDRYGYVAESKEIELVTVRVIASEKVQSGGTEIFEDMHSGIQGEHNELIRQRSCLGPGEVLMGPAVVQDTFSTLYVAEQWRAVIGSAGSVQLQCTTGTSSVPQSENSDVIQLELFTCRFQSLVEEMGVLLQRCASSVNIKERLDFSCALLDAEGQLIANAPHIPVHLGALGLCTRMVNETLRMKPGDVVITNHPGVGGSHLPDVTLIAPVHDDQGQLLGYVANRAHHAEIGGRRPGSMPPDAMHLAEEGVVIPPTHLIREGVADWQSLRERLATGPWPSRAVEENVADLHAQLAAIRRGANALQSLANQVGAEKLHHYMRLLKNRSADLLTKRLTSFERKEFHAEDCMDDGTPICVEIQLISGGLVIDFAGSGLTHPGNLNAAPAIVHSAIIYVLRLLVGQDIPLNEGLLRDVEIIIPRGILSPEFSKDPLDCPAVVGGNVETSQRVVDVLLQAFGLAACSQGTMNNVTFGNQHFSCYETIGGGAGATPHEDGCSAVHVHMTNTAITDPEVMEARLPVRVERFSVRRDSGGQGKRRGGDGIERHIRFLEPAELSMLTQRRLIGPPGYNGGKAGDPGKQRLVRVGGEKEALSSISAVQVRTGDLLMIQTPGGGGWGNLESKM